ncbi:MAG: hypothetical protein GQ583_13075, partial [Methyloprofundus sp.]|nr:hypothetical protein [Methyloprofundus sp.]
RCHAQILLKADISDQGDGWTDLQISQAFDITTRTVERVRQRLVEDAAKQSRVRNRRLDGEQDGSFSCLVMQ